MAETLSKNPCWTKVECKNYIEEKISGLGKKYFGTFYNLVNKILESLDENKVEKENNYIEYTSPAWGQGGCDK